MPSSLLAMKSAPHLARHVDVAVHNIVRVSLVARGMSQAQATVTGARLDAAAIAFTAGRVDTHLKAGAGAEDAYDKAFADLSEWVKTQK